MRIKNKIHLEEKLKRFLNLYWLRPENGLLLAFKSKTFEDIKFEPPSIDICCGDGLFMFLHLGGILNTDVDYFQSTRAKEFKHSSFIDIYDSYDDTYEVRIVKKPITMIDYGSDWKQSLLNKASKLNLYKNLVLHDNNKIPIPFPNNFFKTVHSNSIYWIKNVEGLVSDIYRMMKPNGTAIFEAATPYFLETLDKMEKYLSKEAIAILDRKRRETWPGSHRFREWKKLMLKCGFKIEKVDCLYFNRILIDIWNIGLRPISHLLIQMSDALSYEERHRIKQEWVEIFFTLFKPLLRLNQTYSLDKAPCIMFILKK